jgi:hypothetical protein
VIPVAAGLGGADYTDPAVYDAGFRRAMLIGAALLVAASVMSAVLIRPAKLPAGSTLPVPAGEAGDAVPAVGALRLARCPHCGVVGPQLHPGAAAEAARP